MFVLMREVMNHKEVIGIFSSFEKAEEAGLLRIGIELSDNIYYSIYQYPINTVSRSSCIGRLIGSVERNAIRIPTYYPHQDPKPLKVGTLVAFAYDVLNDDPIACDAVRDVLKV